MESTSAREPSLPEKEPSNPSPTETIGSTPDHGDALDPKVDTYLTGYRLIVILIAFCAANFLVALDTTILATAIPVISEQFRALEDVGWYVSAYFLTNCAFQLLYGKLYTLYPVKPVYIAAVAIFEIGSLICAVAPSSSVFIFGRALAGLGSAGTFSGGKPLNVLLCFLPFSVFNVREGLTDDAALIAIIHVTRPEKRAAYSGMIVGMYGIASIAGPLIGGAFTSHVTWRWCFYINLPIGGVTMVGLLFFLHTPKQPKPAEEARTGLGARIAKFDPFGSIFFLASIICLLLALQLGGTTYAFSNARIIALYIVFGLLLIAFLALQFWGGKNATIPTSVLKQRSVLFGLCYMFCVGGHFFVLVYFLPIWFQGVRGRSALESGIDTLPILLAQTVFVVLGGIIVSVTGYYIPLMWVSVVMASVGAGLLTTLDVGSGSGIWIGAQIIYGIGGGLGYQQGITAAQTVLGPTEVAIGTALMVFVQNLGGTVFVSAANNVFVTRLVKKLASVAPDLDPEAITSAGATGVKEVVQPAAYPSVLVAYNSAVVETFKMGLILACLCAVGTAGMEWRRAQTKEKLKKEVEIEEGQANEVEMKVGQTTVA
jgi:MFS family permease